MVGSASHFFLIFRGSFGGLKRVGESTDEPNAAMISLTAGNAGDALSRKHQLRQSEEQGRGVTNRELIPSSAGVDTRRRCRRRPG